MIHCQTKSTFAFCLNNILDIYVDNKGYQKHTSIENFKTISKIQFLKLSTFEIETFFISQYYK